MKRTVRAVIALSVIASTSFVSSNQAINAVSSNPAPVCSGTTCTITFAFTGDYYAWTVPSGTSSLTVDAKGAKGGKGMNSGSTATPGNGGRVQATLSVTPGSSLYLYVGGQGSSATTSGSTGTGGWNGGGRGGVGNGTGWSGGGGGGASDVRTAAGNLNTRLIVAGGGGGSSCDFCNANDNGGDGGGLTGLSGTTYLGHSGGGGGTQSSGGLGTTTYTGWAVSQAGSLGLGGHAHVNDVTTPSSSINGGGGGGGGYYGGGGGTWRGGGGGSSYTDPVKASNVTHTQGGNAGDGTISITYSVALPAINISIAGNASSVTKGQIVQLTANVDQAGKVTFLANGKRIPGCISISTAGGNVICNWKSAVNKPVQITATISQSGSVKSVSTSILASSTKRTGLR